jgi:hypothetical protein
MQEITPVDLDKLTDFRAMIRQATDCKCWVCDNYVEMLFEVSLPDKFAHMKIESVYLHFDFEGYKPFVMRKKEK